MFPYSRKHTECVHYKDGFCELHKINIDPNSPICPYFTPKEGTSPTKPSQGYVAPPTIPPYPQYSLPYSYYLFPWSYYWGYPQIWSPWYSPWYLQMYFNPLLPYYLMQSLYSWFMPFWPSPWYLPWYWFYPL